MVDASYLEGRPAPPSALKRFVDQTMFPVAIDMAGGMEGGLERMAVAVRQRPAVAMGGAVLLGLLVTRLAFRACMGPARRRSWLRR